MPMFKCFRAAARVTLAVALVGTILASTIASPPASATVLVTRYAGDDPTTTAVAISEAMFAPGVPIVYIATSDIGYALPAAAAAGALQGPVLLTSKDVLPDSTATELGRLRPGRIVAVGGTRKISDSVADELRSYATNVSRQAGDERVATAAAVSADAFDPGVPVAYIVRYDDYPTMFAAAAAAGALGGPLLLTKETSVPTSTALELARLRPGRIIVAGGTSMMRRWCPGVARGLYGRRGIAPGRRQPLRDSGRHSGGNLPTRCGRSVHRERHGDLRWDDRRSRRGRAPPPAAPDRRSGSVGSDHGSSWRARRRRALSSSAARVPFRRQSRRHSPMRSSPDPSPTPTLTPTAKPTPVPTPTSTRHRARERQRHGPTTLDRRGTRPSMTMWRSIPSHRCSSPRSATTTSR